MYRQKQWDFFYFFIFTNQFLGFRIFSTKLCLKIILNYVMKDITELIDIPFFFMQYVDKNGQTWVFLFNAMYLYTVSNLHINLFLEQHVMKKEV